MAISFASLFVFYLVVLAFTPTNGTELKIDAFDCSQPNCDKFVSIIKDPDSRHVYVMTQHMMYKLDEHFDNSQYKIKTTDQPEVKNVLMFLLPNKQLLLCKNDVDGTCELRETILLNVEEKYRVMLVTPGGDPPIGWIDSGPGGKDILNVAVSSKDTSGGMTFLMSSRDITDPESPPTSNGFLSPLQDEYSIPSSQFQSISCALTEFDIKPFYGFSTDKYRYFLKYHISNNSDTKMKIARLCKNSSSYWSYIELPIECEAEGDNLVDNGLLSYAAYFANNYLYISFTRSRSSGPFTNVCSYNTTSIDAEFKQRRKDCLQGKTPTTESDYGYVNYCPTQPVTQFNISQLDEDDFCYDLPVAQPLGGTKPIKEAALSFVYAHAVITTMLVASAQNNDIVYVMGDKEGGVHKITESKRELETVDEGHEIVALMLNTDGDMFYTMSQRKIISSPLVRPPTTQPPPTTTRKSSVIIRYPTSKPSAKNFLQKYFPYIIAAAAAMLFLLVAISIIIYCCVCSDRTGTSEKW